MQCLITMLVLCHAHRYVYCSADPFCEEVLSTLINNHMLATPC
jgi:hypothetical protein